VEGSPVGQPREPALEQRRRHDLRDLLHHRTSARKTCFLRRPTSLQARPPGCPRTGDIAGPEDLEGKNLLGSPVPTSAQKDQELVPGVNLVGAARLTPSAAA
jgi:hypothetical protein